MAKVIIFGVQDFAQLANFYLKNDSQHQPAAFCVNEKYMPDGKKFEGLPVVSFEDVQNIYNPEEYSFFAPMSPKQMNKLRCNVYNSIKEKGYSMISYVSSKATVFNNKIGDNCFILEDNTLQPFTDIGNNVVLWSGNHIGHHGIIEDHVFFTSHVVMSGHCRIKKFSFLGVNSTIRDGVTLAEGSLIAMDASVTKDTEDWGIYKGSPAVKGSKLSNEINF